MSGDSGRDYQYQILNDDNFFSFLFGAGVGKYSPENPYASLSMPDAMIFRIFNEMGLLGTMAFLLFFAQNIFRALKKRNGFMIAVITYAFFANCFNRVLFAAPISVIPYVIIAALNWSKNDMSQTRIDSNR